MACFAPLQGYRSRSVGSSGKRPIVFSVHKGFADLPMSVPCGQCAGCRLERSRQWAIRCVHEASLYDCNCFITLTYSDSCLPIGGSLDKRAFPKFMKRLRKGLHDGKAPGFSKVRYFQCGEYGAAFGRPHHHACLFGFDFPDKVPWMERKGLPVWRSPWLEELWPYGRSELGTVTFESASYVARYIMQKITGPSAKEHYVALDEATGELVPLTPEFTTMSRRPGIGAPWFEKYGKEVYPADSVVMRGRLMKPPRFYDGLYELVDAPGALEVARERRRLRHPEDETPERLLVREQCTRARLARSERTLP